MDIEFLLSIGKDEEVAHLLTRFFENGAVTFHFCPSSDYSEATYRCLEQQGFKVRVRRGSRASLSFVPTFHSTDKFRQLWPGQRVCEYIIDNLHGLWKHRQRVPSNHALHVKTFEDRELAVGFCDFFASRGFFALLNARSKNDNTGRMWYHVFVGMIDFSYNGQHARRQPNLRLPRVAELLSSFLPRDVIVHIVLPYVSRN